VNLGCLWLVSGPRQAGKTNFCRILAETAQAAGWDVAGILSAPVFQDGLKTGILVQDLRTGESRPLAQLETLNLEPSTFNLKLGQWLFDPSALDWGNKVLAASLPCGLLVVDEIGPLELIQRRGWQTALEILPSRQYRAALVVVRPELQAAVQNLFDFTGVILVDPGLSPAGQAHDHWQRILSHAQEVRP
jgi:nucleoside-triphosphatase THEP1